MSPLPLHFESPFPQVTRWLVSRSRSAISCSGRPTPAYRLERHDKPDAPMRCLFHQLRAALADGTRSDGADSSLCMLATMRSAAPKQNKNVPARELGEATAGVLVGTASSRHQLFMISPWRTACACASVLGKFMTNFAFPPPAPPTVRRASSMTGRFLCPGVPTGRRVSQ